MPPGAAYATIGDTDECATCGRTLVEQRRWNAMPKSLRKQLGTTHARRYSAATCQTCATWHNRQAEETDLAYRGGWVRSGLILRPDAPRPVDTPQRLAGGPQKKPIKHGTDTGYGMHRKRKEAACEECKAAHRAAVKQRAAAKRGEAA